jgi:hypothetical protein
LAQVQSALIVKQRKAEQEKISLQVKWEEEKSQLQQSKDPLLAEKLEVQERVHRALLSVMVIEVKIEERVPQQVAQLEEVIQQLQQCIAYLELCTMLDNP